MVEIRSKSIPASPRSKRYPAGSVISGGGGGGSTTITGGGGSSVDIVKQSDSKSFTDSNVLSSLRTMLEIRSRILAEADVLTEPTDDNMLSSLRAVAEIDKAIQKALAYVEKTYLNKTKDDKAVGNYEFAKDITVGQLAKMLKLEVTQLATIAQAVVGMISSPVFVDGFVGEGYKIWKDIASGDWTMTLDRITVRKVMAVYELLIQRVRSVGGSMVMSQADGKIKTVKQAGSNYILTFEVGNTFQPNDLLRHQVFTGDSVKYYWVEVAYISGDTVAVPVSEFGDVAPAVGDEVVQMGNTRNVGRQSLIMLSTEEGAAISEVVGEFEKMPNEHTLERLCGRNYVAVKDGAIISDVISFVPDADGNPLMDTVRMSIEEQQDINTEATILFSAEVKDGVISICNVLNAAKDAFVIACVTEDLTGETSPTFDFSFTKDFKTFIPFNYEAMGISDVNEITVKGFIYNSKDREYLISITNIITTEGSGYDRNCQYLISTSDFSTFTPKMSKVTNWDTGYSYDIHSVHNSDDYFCITTNDREYFLNGKRLTLQVDSSFLLWIKDIYKLSDCYLVIGVKSVCRIYATFDANADAYTATVEETAYPRPREIISSNVCGSFEIGNKIRVFDARNFYNVYDKATGMISSPEPIIDRVGDSQIIAGGGNFDFRSVLRFASGVMVTDPSHDANYYQSITRSKPNGKPKIDLLDGVNSKSFEGKLKTRIGWIGDITDTHFPADKQPSGYGVYTNSLFARDAVIILKNGKDLETQFSVIDGEILAAINTSAQYTNGEVGKVNTELKLIPGKITIAVSESLKNAKSYTDSEVKVVKDAISLKVSQKSFDELTNTVSTAVSQIEANTQGLTLTASSAAVNGINERLKEAEIKIQPDNIWLGVKDRLQVGGRNYYRRNSQIIALYGSPTILQNDPRTPNGIHVTGDSSGVSAMRIIGVIDSNGPWTVSFDLRGSQNANLFAFNVNICDVGYLSPIITPDNQWTHHSLTVNVTNYTSNTYNFVDFESIAWAYVHIANLKIEKGSIETDWTPAPEDVSTKQELLDTGINIANQSIVLTANKTLFRDNNGNEIAMFENGKIKASLIETNRLTATDGRGNTLNIDGNGVKVESFGFPIANLNWDFVSNTFGGFLELSANVRLMTQKIRIDPNGIRITHDGRTKMYLSGGGLTFYNDNGTVSRSY